GGGAPLYQGGKGDDGPYVAQYVEAHHFFELEISAERLRGRAITKDHEVIDDFTILKEGARPELDFVRGDVDRSGALDLTDAILILAHLFGGVLLEFPLWGDVD